MQGGTNSYVHDLMTLNSRLVAGGRFSSAGGEPVGNIAGWDGSVWQPLGSGLDHYVYALCNYNDQVVAGGSFFWAGSKVAAYWARFSSVEVGDLNCDQFVDLLDLVIMARHWLEPQ